MARKQYLINYHTSGVSNPLSGDVKMGEIVVKHNDEKPSLVILKNNGEWAEFIDENAIETKLSATTKNLEGQIDAVESNLEENYATSADTAAAIKTVDDKFADYATSADTVAAIETVDGKFADYATSADTVAAIKVVQDDVDAVESNLEENYATSAATVAAIEAVDGKFADYATSADTVAAIETVDGKFADYATSADTVAAIKVVQDKVDAVESELDEAISALTETINTKVSAAYIYQGSKSSYEELPNDDSVKVGHVWNVEAAYQNHPAGTNYAWTGSEWDALAGIVDLTIYATSADTVAAIKVVQDEVDAVESNLEENYATSAATVAAIEAVDGKFADYATSADTVAAIETVDGKFADYATSADTVAAIKVVQDEVDAVESNLEENYATSAATVAAIEAVDGKFADYATSADTVAAIETVDGKFADYATSADTVAAIKVVQDDVDAVESRVQVLESVQYEIKGTNEYGDADNSENQTVKVTKSGSTVTFDFNEMVIDGGEF